MPVGYWRNKHNHVYTLAHNKQGESFAVEVINYPIHDAGLNEQTAI